MLQYFIPTKKQFGSVINHYEDDDFIDRLNNRWTVRILVICIGVIMGNMFWSKQIQCWIPNEFTEHHTEYAHTVCWLKGTYYLPTEEINIPDRSKPRTYFVSYYQWTPFILAGMAVLFGEITFRRSSSLRTPVADVRYDLWTREKRQYFDQSSE